MYTRFFVEGLAGYLDVHETALTLVRFDIASMELFWTEAPLREEATHGTS